MAKWELKELPIDSVTSNQWKWKWPLQGSATKVSFKSSRELPIHNAIVDTDSHESIEEKTILTCWMGSANHKILGCEKLETDRFKSDVIW